MNRAIKAAAREYTEFLAEMIERETPRAKEAWETVARESYKLIRAKESNLHPSHYMHPSNPELDSIATDY